MKIKMSLLLAATVAVAAFAQPMLARAAGLQANPGVFGEQSAPYTLSFYNTHTREELTVTYRRRGMVVSTAMDEVDNFLRDHRTGDAHNMSEELLDVLHDIQQEILRRHPGKDVVFHVISGYRSPRTNAMLRATSGGQAKKSRHMEGDAIDIRVPGVDSAEIRDIAWCLQRGGVGYYRGSDFVHVDTWNVRHWNWKPTAQTCGGDSTS